MIKQTTFEPIKPAALDQQAFAKLENLINEVQNNGDFLRFIDGMSIELVFDLNSLQHLNSQVYGL
jgi:hypothetical protein